jgi:hypothetical protein
VVQETTNADVKHVLDRVEQWPEEDQDELASAAVGRGEIATAAEMEAVFSKYRRP